MTHLKTEILQGDKHGLTQAVKLLHGGDLVAFPTETVYGLGADARNQHAVASIFSAKSRPTFNPLIVHVADQTSAQNIVVFNEAANLLATTFWPGPLTLVLPLQPNTKIAPQLTAGLQTVAIRVPAHPLARDLLALFNAPVAAPSANPSGGISPTTASHVINGLGGRIAAVLDGGPCHVGLESTIIGFKPEPVLLRPGGVSVEAIQDCLGSILLAATPSASPNAPGQLISHYAPRAQVRLNADHAAPGEVLLGFGFVDCQLNLSETGNLHEAAANLFQALHELDTIGAQTIAVSPIPNHGLGRAINDRLLRAAAPRGTNS